MARRSIKSRVKHWQKKLLLGDWKITVVVGVPDDGSRANCDASPEYKEATLTFDPDRIPTDPKELDSWIIHELTHCVTWPLETLAEQWGRSESQYQFARSTAESVVTNFEHIILNLTKRG
jgi:hypothetical protein